MRTAVCGSACGIAGVHCRRGTGLVAGTHRQFWRAADAQPDARVGGEARRGWAGRRVGTLRAQDLCGRTLQICRDAAHVVASVRSAGWQLEQRRGLARISRCCDAPYAGLRRSAMPVSPTPLGGQRSTFVLANIVQFRGREIGTPTAGGGQAHELDSRARSSGASVARLSQFSRSPAQVLKSVFSFMLVLVASLGWGVTRPYLDQRTHGARRARSRDDTRRQLPATAGEHWVSTAGIVAARTAALFFGGVGLSSASVVSLGSLKEDRAPSDRWRLRWRPRSFDLRACASARCSRRVGLFWGGGSVGWRWHARTPGRASLDAGAHGCGLRMG